MDGFLLHFPNLQPRFGLYQDPTLLSFKTACSTRTSNLHQILHHSYARLKIFLYTTSSHYNSPNSHDKSKIENPVGLPRGSTQRDSQFALP